MSLGIEWSSNTRYKDLTYDDRRQKHAHTHFSVPITRPVACARRAPLRNPPCMYGGKTLHVDKSCHKKTRGEKEQGYVNKLTELNWGDLLTVVESRKGALSEVSTGLQI